jgi:hypothetical protein
MPGALRGVPLQPLMAGIGLALVTASSIAMALVRGEGPVLALEQDEVTVVDGGVVATVGTSEPLATSRAAAGPTRLTAHELDAARLGGPSALVALAQRYPEEAPVLQALAFADVHDQKDFLAAIRALRHLVEIAPEKSADKEVQQLVIDVANGPADAAEEAFDVLKTKMRSHGPDILYDLISSATGKYAKEHAAGALSEPAAQKNATKALLIAEELRRNLPCGRRLLISRAAADGDARSLPYLKQIIPAKSCRGGGGFVGLFRGPECHQLECYTPADRAAVTSAIDAIEKREKR